MAGQCAHRPEQPGEDRAVVRRRFFLGSIGAAGAAGLIAACEQDGPSPVAEGEPPVAPEVARAPQASGDAVRFLNMDQARTVDAIAARIIPGDEAEPGAREAGVVFYIDQMLDTHAGYPDPAYMQGPFAQTPSGDSPPEDDDSVVWVQEDELERYGRQSPFVPRDIYRMGLARLDVLARERFDNDFADATEQEQDELLAAVEDAEDDDVLTTFGDLAPDSFFEAVRSHVIEGFLADPVYGGNRDMVGWRLIGFPGSRRSYSPTDMLDEDYDVTPQSLADLPPFNADRHEHHDDVLTAVRTRHPLGPVD